jgi:NAD(P)H-flavin reductase
MPHNLRTNAPDPVSSWIAPRPWRVRANIRESHDTVTLELAPDGPFAFQPGQFNMLYAEGIGEAPISISGDPASTGPILHTIRAVGAVTQALCASEPGDLVGVRGPYGSCWPVEQAAGSDVLIVAGGIGLPPLRPAIYYTLAHRELFGKIIVLYGARTPANLLFTAELARWRARSGLTVEVTVDAADRTWRGDVGVVPGLIQRVAFDPAGAVAFMVGPEIMMRFTVRALQQAGVRDERIFLSMERDMQCAAALCGHCQLGPFLLCRDGPVLGYPRLAPWLTLREV